MSKIMVKVRVIAREDVIEQVTEAISDALEAKKFEVIEMSTPQPMNPPDGDKERQYLVAVQ